MKAKKLLLVLFFSSALFSSCNIFIEDIGNEPEDLYNLVTSYELWYVDINQTQGTGDVPFLSKAFTVSFQGGLLYANNNIAEIGFTGNGFGIIAGNFNTARGVFQMIHSVDGLFDFDVEIVSANEIRIYDRFQDVSYLLVGYQRANFDYDRLFYENIEYFLQEYETWERVSISGGTPNPFDNEHYFKFVPQNNSTFFSSKDDFGTSIDNIFYDYEGDYEVFDVVGVQTLKILSLNYGGGDIEEFELTILNDQNIRLFSTTSGTRYDFTGLGFIQFLKNGKQKSSVRNSGRKRTKIIRQKKIRKH